MPTDYYSVSQAAKEIGVSQETVRRYIREKRLPASKRRVKGLRKEWAIAKPDVAAFKNGD